MEEVLTVRSQENDIPEAHAACQERKRSRSALRVSTLGQISIKNEKGPKV